MTEKMKLPYFDFYYQDFLTGTAHFTHQQKGIYITLMCHAGVRNGDGLPNNFEQLCTIVNVYSNDPEQVESLKTDTNTVLHEKFKLIDNKWHNERQLEDYRRTVEKINHRAEAGRKGGLAKAKQTSSTVSVSDSVSVSFNNIWDALLVKRGSKKKALEFSSSNTICSALLIPSSKLLNFLELRLCMTFQIFWQEPMFSG